MVAYKWIFDYNVVAHLDPDYTQYLDDTRNQTRKIVDDRCQQLGISIRLPDTRVRYRMELAEQRRQQHGREVRLAFNHEYTEFEQDVIDLMTTNKQEESANTFTENSDYDAEFYDPAHIAEDLKKEFDEDTFQKHTRNHLLYVPYYYKLKSEYKNPPKVEMDKYIGPELQLMPPKTVLDVGSQIVYETGIYHGINETSYADASVLINRCKFTKDKKDGKIRLIYSSYWFDRINNATHEIKDHFNMATYNPKTKQMYIRKYEAKKTRGDRVRYKVVLHNCGINMVHISSLLLRVEALCPEIGNKFVRAIFEAVQADVPDVWVDYDRVFLPQWITSPEKQEWENRSTARDFVMYQLGHLVLEHKIGRPIPWLDIDTYHIMTRMYEDRALDTEQEYCDGRIHEITDLMKVRKKRIGKLIANLKKHNNFTSMVQTLLGAVYSKQTMQFIKIFQNDAGVHEIINLNRLMNDDEAPKICKHFISSTLNKLSKCWIPRNEKAFAKSAIDYIIDSVRPHGQRGRRSPWTESYVKLCSRFINVDDGKLQGVPTWYTWEDMMTMANQIHVRVRPNKFKDARDVRILHDMLADRHRRDQTAIRKYKHQPFLEFDHPEKEYNGFVFEFLSTAEELVHEGTVMHHCVASYADRCLAGNSLIFSMRKDDKSFVTIELNGRNYDIMQKYTIADNVITNMKVLDLINKWHRDIIEMHKNDEDCYEVLAIQRIHEIMKEDDPESYRMLRDIMNRFEWQQAHHPRPVRQNVNNLEYGL
jgi:hypothetical protein